MEPGDLLCLVTDGVTDAQNAAGERYGTRRLQELLGERHAGANCAQALVDAVRADVQSFAAGAEPADDITVLALHWIGPRASA
jgi:sigma-B regulation protein RsbU (phosphoserine phosphatase)